MIYTVKTSYVGIWVTNDTGERKILKVFFYCEGKLLIDK